MIQLLESNDGRFIAHRIRPASPDSQRHTKHAMEGSATKDLAGKIFDIKTVHFLPDPGIPLDQAQETKKGEQIAKTLGLKTDSQNRWPTNIGNKTSLGLARTFRQILK
jgi:hypothetical protein